MRRYRTIPFFITHKGCPFRCVFCDQNSITGAAGDTPEMVPERIERYLETIASGAYVQVGFFGGSFTALPAEEQTAFLRPVRRYLERGLVHSMRVSTRPDRIDTSKLELLKDFGVGTIELGVQSSSESVLKASARGYDHARTIRSSTMIRRYGFALGHQLMLGLPGSGPGEELESAREAVRLGASEARIYPLVVIEGTPLADMWRSGAFRALDEEEALKRACRIMVFLESRGVKVIRCGLHASEGLASGENVCAGPFHPAFGAKVRSRIFGMLLERLSRDETGPLKRLAVNSSESAPLRGFEGENASPLRRLLGDGRPVPDGSVPRLSVKAVGEGSERTAGPGELDAFFEESEAYDSTRP